MALGPLLTLLRRYDLGAFRRISGDWTSVLRFHFLYAAEECGLLTALQQPRSMTELAQELGAQRPEILEALVDLGVSVGELRRAGGRVALKGRRSKALASGTNDPLTAMVQANVTYYNNIFRGLASSLAGGALADEPGTFGPLVARLSRIAEPYLEHYLKKLARGRGAIRVLDVGCGSGTNLRFVLEAEESSQGVGLELEADVVRQAQDNFRAWGLDGRVDVVEGSALPFPSRIEGTFDVILALNLVYYFEVGERVELLRALRERLADGGALVVVTGCRGASMHPFTANLNVATSCMKGTTPLPTVEEMEAQLAEAGFARTGRTRLSPGTGYYGFMAG